MSEQQKVKHTRARKVFVARRVSEQPAADRLTHALTLADVARLDRARAEIMHGRRFAVDSAELLHVARQEGERA